MLLVVGLVDRRLVGKHRRAITFEPRDYDRLVEFIREAGQIFVTPNVLTEASNLLENPQDTRFLEKLRELIETSHETAVDSTRAAHNSGIHSTGTDGYWSPRGCFTGNSPNYHRPRSLHGSFEEGTGKACRYQFHVYPKFVAASGICSRSWSCLEGSRLIEFVILGSIPWPCHS